MPTKGDSPVGATLFEATAWYDDGDEPVAGGGFNSYFEQLEDARSWLRTKLADCEREDPATENGRWYGVIDRGSFVRDGSTGFDEIDLTWESDDDWPGETIHLDAEDSR